jgi:large subunit ribosomal protein L6
MKRELFQIIEIPEGVALSMEENTITVKGKEGEISRSFNFGRLEIKLENNELRLEHKTATKTEKKIMNTIASHIKNMIAGVQEKFVYELKVCSGHFPMTLKQEGKKVIVKNFLGEKIDRSAKIIDGAEVEINKDIVTVKSVNKEIAGQTAANFEKATIIKGRDKRVFQDGIYITKKCGKAI